MVVSEAVKLVPEERFRRLVPTRPWQVLRIGFSRSGLLQDQIHLIGEDVHDFVPNEWFRRLDDEVQDLVGTRGDSVGFAHGAEPADELFYAVCGALEVVLEMLWTGDCVHEDGEGLHDWVGNVSRSSVETKG
jgi:hypothetical protein